MSRLSGLLVLPALLLAGCGGGGGGGGGGEGRVVVSPQTPAGTPVAPIPTPAPTPTETPAPLPPPTTTPALPTPSAPPVDVPETPSPALPSAPLALPEPAVPLAFKVKRNRIEVRPGNFASAFAGAQDGDLLVLTPGDHGELLIAQRNFNDPVMIDASAATVSVRLQTSSGVQLRLGNVRGGTEWRRGVTIDRASRIDVQGGRVHDAVVGIHIARSSDVTVRDVQFTGIDVDGLTIAMSSRVGVRNISCSAWAWTPDNELHPDCVQLWPEGEINTSDVTLQSITAEGPMQGIMARAAAGGRLERISIRGLTTHLQGTSIYLADCDGCRIDQVRARTMAGARWQSRVHAPGSVLTDVVVEPYTP